MKKPITTEQGYLINMHDWSVDVAHNIAQEFDIILEEEHWQIIHFMREFYLQYQNIPVMRLFIKAIRAEVSNDMNSITLNCLFPPSFLKTACKIAGLPKPKHCL